MLPRPGSGQVGIKRRGTEPPPYNPPLNPPPRASRPNGSRGGFGVDQIVAVAAGEVGFAGREVEGGDGEVAMTAGAEEPVTGAVGEDRGVVREGGFADKVTEVQEGGAAVGMAEEADLEGEAGGKLEFGGRVEIAVVALQAGIREGCEVAEEAGAMEGGDGEGMGLGDGLVIHRWLRVGSN